MWCGSHYQHSYELNEETVIFNGLSLVSENRSTTMEQQNFFFTKVYFYSYAHFECYGNNTVSSYCQTPANRPTG